jgi:hypothetical protein
MQAETQALGWTVEESVTWALSMFPRWGGTKEKVASQGPMLPTPRLPRALTTLAWRPGMMEFLAPAVALAQASEVAKAGRVADRAQAA